MSTIYDRQQVVMACSNGPDNVIEDPLVFVSLGMPNDLFCLTSIIVDGRTYYLTRDRSMVTKNPQQSNPVSNEGPGTGLAGFNDPVGQPGQSRTRNPMLDIPLKATLLSTLFALPGVFLGTLTSILEMSLFYKQYLVFMFLMVVAAIRMPVIVSLTFKRNELNRAITQEALKEELRKQEILHALRERELRREAWIPL